MDLEQWAVGGRGFSWILRLPAAGRAKSIPPSPFSARPAFPTGRELLVYYILAYGSLAYVIAYFLLPLVWSYGRQHGLHHPQKPDFFVRKYASPSLGVLVSIVDLVALVPYLVLQLTGLGIIVTAAAATWAPSRRMRRSGSGAAIVTVYVMIVRDPRGSAYTACGQGHPDRWRGALPRHLSAVASLWRHRPDVREDRRRQAWLPLSSRRAGRASPGSSPPCCLPRLASFHVAAILRRRLLGEGRARLPAQCDRLADLPAHTAILYSLRYWLRRGAASARTEGGRHQSRAVFKLAAQEFSPAVVGLIGAAGVFLSALVPGSLIAMTAAMLLSKNLVGLLASGRATDAQTVALAKWLFVPVVMLVAVYFTLTGNTTIVTMLLVGYSFVTQLFSGRRREPDAAQSDYAGRRLRRNSGRRNRRRGSQLLPHATVGSLFPALPQARIRRPQRRHHRACREYRRDGRRQQSVTTPRIGPGRLRCSKAWREIRRVRDPAPLATSLVRRARKARLPRRRLWLKIVAGRVTRGHCAPSHGCCAPFLLMLKATPTTSAPATLRGEHSNGHQLRGQLRLLGDCFGSSRGARLL